MRKIAIVGAGNMAREHIRAFSALPDTKVVGISSRTRTKASEVATEFSIEVVANDIEHLYMLTNACLVVIAVPELELNAVAKKAFTFPWAVLLEKPAGFDLSDAVDIKNASKRRSAPVFVGLNRRFYSSVLTAKDDINQRPELERFVHIQDQQSFDEARRYNHPEEVVQKFMYANSIHNIDLINFFCRGEILNIENILPFRGEDTQIVLSLITFDSGDKALYQGIWNGPGGWSCTIATNYRRWILQPVEKAEYQNYLERNLTPANLDNDDILFKPGLLKQARSIIERIGGQVGRNEPVLLNESMRSMKLINQIFEI